MTSKTKHRVRFSDDELTRLRSGLASPQPRALRGPPRPPPQRRTLRLAASIGSFILLAAGLFGAFVRLDITAH